MLKTNKIDKGLVKALNLIDVDDNIEFLVYGSNLEAIKNYLTKNNCKATSLNIIGAVAGLTSKQNFSNLKFGRGISKVSASARVNCLIDKSLKTTNITYLHQAGLTGKNVTVAIIDTGISPHFDLMFPIRRVKFFKNFVGENQAMHDDNGHGTFVAGIIASSGLLSNKRYKGVAPNCNLVVLKALDGNGEASAIKILEAMQWVKANAKQYNIKVLCLSIGAEPEGKYDPLAIASEVLTKNGICVVAAAGNSGPVNNTIKSPGISSLVITVGAVDDREEENIKIADFSSRGPAYKILKPDVVAPGVNIVGLSAMLNSPYIKLSGTSMATPIVAGFCALLIENFPKITPFQIKYIVKNSARQITFNHLAEGSGLIDASKIKIT